MTADQIDVLSKLFASLADSIHTLWVVGLLAVIFQAFWAYTIERRLRTIEKKDAA